MRRQALEFDLPETTYAAAPPETRGLARDQVRLLVLDRRTGGAAHGRFRDLPDHLNPGDLLVVNNSRTIPASLPAVWCGRPIRLHLSTDLRDGRWIVEPRRADGSPGPNLLSPGDTVALQGVKARLAVLHRYKTFERLWVVESGAELMATALVTGDPIRYGYVPDPWPLPYYQTMFARRPGSAEMPSAGRPFTPRVVQALRRRGVRLAELTLHTGVSSHEVAEEVVDDHPMYPEWMEVPAETAGAINETRRQGGRVIAVGTTVVRALETAANQSGVVAPERGFTQLFIRPGHRLRAVDGLVTGLHAPETTHLALLSTFIDTDLLKKAYGHAVRRGYRWHEFGDASLIL